MDKASQEIFQKLYDLHDRYDESPEHMICAHAADHIKKLSEELENLRLHHKNESYMEGVKYAIYEIMKEADIPGSNEIRDSGDTDDGMCARAAEKIRAELAVPLQNEQLTCKGCKHISTVHFEYPCDSCMRLCVDRYEREEN